MGKYLYQTQPGRESQLCQVSLHNYFLSFFPKMPSSRFTDLITSNSQIIFFVQFFEVRNTLNGVFSLVQFGSGPKF